MALGNPIAPGVALMTPAKISKNMKCRDAFRAILLRLLSFSIVAADDENHDHLESQGRAG